MDGDLVDRLSHEQREEEYRQEFEKEWHGIKEDAVKEAQLICCSPCVFTLFVQVEELAKTHGWCTHELRDNPAHDALLQRQEFRHWLLHGNWTNRQSKARQDLLEEHDSVVQLFLSSTFRMFLELISHVLVHARTMCGLTVSGQRYTSRTQFLNVVCMAIPP